MKTIESNDIENRSIKIYGFMISQLGLSGNDLIIYALMYCFSQSGKAFKLNINYAMKWVKNNRGENLSLQAFYSIINRLAERKLIKVTKEPGETERTFFVNKEGLNDNCKLSSKEEPKKESESLEDKSEPKEEKESSEEKEPNWQEEHFKTFVNLYPANRFKNIRKSELKKFFDSIPNEDYPEMMTYIDNMKDKTPCYLPNVTKFLLEKSYKHNQFPSMGKFETIEEEHKDWYYDRHPEEQLKELEELSKALNL